MEAQYKAKTSRTITAISEFASNTAKESGVTIPVIIKNQSHRFYSTNHLLHKFKTKNVKHLKKEKANTVLAFPSLTNQNIN